MRIDALLERPPRRMSSRSNTDADEVPPLTLILGPERNSEHGGQVAAARWHLGRDGGSSCTCFEATTSTLSAIMVFGAHEVVRVRIAMSLLQVRSGGARTIRPPAETVSRAAS